MRNDERSAPPLLTSSWPNMVPVTLLLVSEAIGKSDTYERLDSKTKNLKKQWVGTKKKIGLHPENWVLD